ncbi:hypothetical protein [Streptomyces sp. NPDC001815]|uniref:hypothetical protein n=1 Tax=Streptomyces sp. NPDC001815 TaxID=3154526 RepID=UPI00332DD347
MAILAVVGLAVVGMSNGGGAGTGGGDGKSPRPLMTAQYPIKFENSTTNTTKVKRPQSTVSYPIPWASGGAR